MIRVSRTPARSGERRRSHPEKPNGSPGRAPGREEVDSPTIPPGEDLVRQDLRSFSRAWWLFLVTGILWVWVGFFVLQFTLNSILTIGY